MYLLTTHKPPSLEMLAAHRKKWIALSSGQPSLSTPPPSNLFWAELMRYCNLSAMVFGNIFTFAAPMVSSVMKHENISSANNRWKKLCLASAWLAGYIVSDLYWPSQSISDLYLLNCACRVNSQIPAHGEHTLFWPASVVQLTGEVTLLCWAWWGSIDCCQICKTSGVWVSNGIIIGNTDVDWFGTYLIVRILIFCTSGKWVLCIVLSTITVCSLLKLTFSPKEW